MRTQATFFVSAVTSEFGSCRDALAAELDFPDVRVEVQEKFLSFGTETLRKLDEYLLQCDAVIHIAGDQSGSRASDANLNWVVAQYPDLGERLQLGASEIAELTYTQWEALLARYHGKPIHIAVPVANALRDSVIGDPEEADRQKAAQVAHLARLRRLGRYPEISFANADKLVIQILRALRELLPARRKPANLPPSIGGLFKGREFWLAEIRRLLTAGDDARGERHGVRRLAMHGMGGIGKTRLAIEYGHTYADHHSALLFVRAEAPATFAEELAGLAGVLGLPAAASNDLQERIRAVRDWLNRPEHRHWLLVIDNVDDAAAATAVEAFLGELRAGEALVTARWDQWSQHFDNVNLDVLPEDAAIAYLLEAANRRVKVDDDNGLAAAINGKVGSLALGLVQAAAAINKLHFSFAEYLAEWEENAATILDDPDFDPALTGYPRTVGITWLTSFQRLTPSARFLLHTLAWFSPDPIPHRVFLRPWPKYIGLPAGTHFDSDRQTRRVLTELTSYSLAERSHPDSPSVVVHRLVQAVARLHQKSELSDGSARIAALCLIEAALSRVDSLATWQLNLLPDEAQCAPHAREILRVLSGAPGEYEHHVAVLLLRLRLDVANLEWIRGRISSALRDAQAACSFADAMNISPPERIRGEMYSLLAVTLMGNSATELTGENLSEAVRYADDAARSFKTVCTDSPEETGAICSLALVLSISGRLRSQSGDAVGALQALEEALTISSDLCSRFPDNSAYLLARINTLMSVGELWRSQRDPDRALDAFEAATKTAKMLYARDPRDRTHRVAVAYCLKLAGDTLRQKSALDGALEAFWESHEILVDLCRYDPHNPAMRRDLAVVLVGIGEVLATKGLREDALENLTSASAILEELRDSEPDAYYEEALSTVLEMIRRLQVV